MPLWLFSIFRKKGFECEVCDPVWLFKAHRDGFFVDLITGMSNATIVVEDSWIELAKPASVQGVQTRVLAAEELVASKLFIVRRERFDGADIAHVILRNSRETRLAARSAAGGRTLGNPPMGACLVPLLYPAQTQYVPKEVWRDLVSRFQEVVSHPEPAAKFRGSLVDDKQFAIDVNEWGLENLMQEYRDRRLRTVPATLTIP